MHALYLLFITPLILSLPVAGAVWLAVVRGRCRNRLLAGALGLAAGTLLYLGSFQAGLVSWFGPAAAGRVDLLPSYIRHRMSGDQLAAQPGDGRLAGGNPGADGAIAPPLSPGLVAINWGVFAFELVAIDVFLLTIAVGRATHPYDEARRRWMDKVSAAFPIGTGQALAEALEAGRLADFAAEIPDRVAAQPPFTNVAAHVTPGPGGQPVPAFLTVWDVVWDDRGQGRITHVDRLELAPDEATALAGLLPIPGPPPDKTGLPRHVVDRTEVAVELVPEDEAGKVLTRGVSLLVNAIYMLPLIGWIAVTGLLYVALRVLDAGRRVGPLTADEAVVAILAVDAVLIAGILAWRRIGPGLARGLARRRAEAAMRWRRGRVVDPDDPEALLVEVVPRAHWGRVMLESAADVGFLRVDPARRMIWFEGDIERYRIPVEAVVSIEVEVPPAPGGGPQADDDPVQFVVVRARRGEEVWEAPFDVRDDGSPVFARTSRRQSADELHRRLVGLLLPRPDSGSAGGGPSSRPREDAGEVADHWRIHAGPRREEGRRDHSWIGILTLVFMLVGVFLGPLITQSGFEQIRIARLSEAEPRPVRLADLGDVWPAGNPYITLTDFEPRLSGFLRKSEDPAGPWKLVHVPLGPAAAGREPGGAAIRVIVRSSHVRDEAGLGRLLADGEVTGLLKERGDFLGPLREALVAFNPGIDLEGCWTLQEGSEPMGLESAFSLTVGACVLFALSFCLLVRAVAGQAEPATGRLLDRASAALGERLRRWQESPSPAPVLVLIAAGLALLGPLLDRAARGYFSDPRATFLNDLGLAAMTDLGLALLLLGLILRRPRRRGVPADA